jgi:ribulose-5-phosphate 4-epimerase/fuculose-1-phosphate aldolase
VTVSPENRECGVRTKFVVKRRDLLPTYYADAASLIRWCRTFDEEGLAPVEGGASAGNLSFRTAAGYVITPTRSRLKANLDWRQFVEVVREDLDAFEIHVLGERAPSSDSFLHGRIYALRPDVAAVFHGHDDLVLKHADAVAKRFDAAVTSEAMLFGTRIDAEETARALGSKRYVIRKGHGFAAVGRTQDEAGELALAVRRFVVSLGS